jgi:endo-1,4-beta-xylanase
MGTAVNYWQLENKQYMDIVEREYDVLVAESACKWKFTQKEKGKFTYEQCWKDFEAACEIGAEFRGHALIWGGKAFNPDWLLSGNKDNRGGGGKWWPGQLKNFMKEHITNVMKNIKIGCGGHQQKPIAWDVVNEAVGNSRENFKLKAAEPWYPALPNYIELAFQYASEADPTIPLFYNDYNIVWDRRKRDAIYNIAKTMKDKNIKIDGIGF